MISAAFDRVWNSNALRDLRQTYGLCPKGRIGARRTATAGSSSPAFSRRRSSRITVTPR